MKSVENKTKFFTDGYARKCYIDRELLRMDQETAEYEAREEGRAEGREEGREEGRRNIIKKMLQMKADYSIIAYTSSITIDEVKAYAKEFGIE